jgi:DNA-binding CsgD family transcriptional regulator
MFLQMRLALLAGDAEALFGKDAGGLRPMRTQGGTGGEARHLKQDAKSGLLADMRSMITRGSDYFMLHTADLCEGWLYAALGLYDRIPGWLRSELGSDSRLYAFARGYYFIVHGRALLLAGEHARLIGLFSGMIQAKAFAINLLFSVYGHIYLAAAYEKTGQCLEAASALNIALSTALPDKLYMPFVENYELIGPVLKKAIHSTGHKEALSRIEGLAEQRMQAGREEIVQAIQARELTQAGSGAEQQTGAGDPVKFHSFVAHYGLTVKEAKVLAFTLQNLSIAEMAGNMDISAGGIKFHISNILDKAKVVKRRDLLPLYAAWKMRVPR